MKYLSQRIYVEYVPTDHGNGVIDPLPPPFPAPTSSQKIGINGERLFGVRVCPRKFRRQFIDRLRSSSEHGSFSLPRLVPALAHQDSGVHRTEQDGSLGSPEAVGQIWGWPLEVYHEEVSQENKSTATATKQAARASVSAEDGLTTSEGKRGDVENAAALAIGEEGARDSRVTSWSQRSKQRREFLECVVAAVAVAVAAAASAAAVRVSS